MPFQPGQSGNPEGSKDRAIFLRALNRAIAQDDGKRLRGAVEKLLDLADGGEQWAVQMLADRLDGKPPQSIDAKLDGSVSVEIVQFTPKPDTPAPE